jgi:hypothetical protein
LKQHKKVDIALSSSPDSQDGTVSLVSLKNGSEENDVNFKSFDGVFPRWEYVIPDFDSDPDSVELTFDLTYLADTLEAIRKILAPAKRDAAITQVKVRFKEDHSAIEFRAERNQESVQGVVMPISSV